MPGLALEGTHLSGLNCTAQAQTSIQCIFQVKVNVKEGVTSGRLVLGHLADYLYCLLSSPSEVETAARPADATDTFPWTALNFLS